MTSKWIRFELAEHQNPKTSIWNVVAKDGEFILGQIRWFGRWRGYAFFPQSNTLYENTCLSDIAGFIESAMRERKR